MYILILIKCKPGGAWEGDIISLAQGQEVVRILPIKKKAHFNTKKC